MEADLIRAETCEDAPPERCRLCESRIAQGAGIENLRKALDRAGEAFARSCETEPEMRGLAKAITRDDEETMLRELAAKIARVADTRQPRERGHAAGGTHPLQQTGITRKHFVQQGEI